MIQGALALGIPLDASFNMAMRCVRDSIPPIRLEVMHYLNRHPEASVNDIMYDIQRPWNAIDKAVQALYSAGMIIGTEVGKRTAYSLRHNVDVDALWVKGKLVDSTAT
jgi:DNA-binding transcriptional ArsR family regulator